MSRRTTRLLFTLIFVLGAGARFYAAGAKTVWLDEAFSIWMARHPLPAMWEWLVRVDQHPPLYYMALHGWMQLFGDLQGPVRSLSALCSALTLPLMYALVQRIGGDRAAALLGMALLAAAPFHIQLAQEARMYALLTLAATSALYCAAVLLTTPAPTGPPGRRVRAWLLPALGLAVCQAAVMLTHNVAAVFFPLALNAAVAGAGLSLRRSPAAPAVLRPRRLAAVWLGSQAGALLLWLPWAAPFAIQAAGVDREFWLQPPTLATFFGTLANLSFAHLPQTAWLAALVALSWLAALVGALALRSRPHWLWLLFALWWGPILGELLISLRRPIFYDRTLIWTTIPYYVLMAVGLTAAGRRLWPEETAPRGARLLRTLPAVAAAVLLIAGVWGTLRYFTGFQKEEWDRAAADVARAAAPGDLLIFNATWVQLPFEYYFRHYDQEVELRGMPADLFDLGTLEPKMTASDVPVLNRLIAGRTHVWLIYSHDWYTDPDAILPRELGQTMRQVDERSYHGLRVLEFAARAGEPPADP